MQNVRISGKESDGSYQEIKSTAGAQHVTDTAANQSLASMAARQKGFKIIQSFTRSSTTTAYSANQSINAVTTAVVMSQDLAAQGAIAGGFFVITNARVVSSVKGSGLNVNVCVFPATFSPTNDYTELSIDDATASLGGIVIPCTNFYTFAVNARAVSDPGWYEGQFAAASTTLYFVLQAAGAYTPASGEVLTTILEGFFLSA